MHTHTHTKFESRHAEVNKDPGIARWCMQCVCDYRFGVLIYDVALRVSPHVFVYAYMFGRLVLLWFIQCVFVCVFF